MPTLQFRNQGKQTGKLEICNQTSEKADLYILGDIVSDGWGKWCDEDTCPKDITEFLSGLGDVREIDLHVNSGGGSVFGGIAIYNMLKRHKARITTYIDGIAASIASVIACAGDRVVIPASGTFMVHKPTNGYFFENLNADQLRKDADTLDACQAAIVQAYMSKVKEGVTEDTVNALVNAESWLVGSAAASYFDFEVEQGVQAADCISSFFGQYVHTPERLTTEAQSYMAGGSGDDIDIKSLEEEKQGNNADSRKTGGKPAKTFHAEGLDALAEAVAARLKEKKDADEAGETEKIKKELLEDLYLFGV